MTYRLTTQVRAMAIRQKGALAAVSILLCGALSGIATAANDQLTMKFTYSVAEGTCTVDASPINFGTVPDTLSMVGKDWHFVGVRVFPVTLKDCVGTGSTAVRVPAITVSGYALATNTGASTDRKKYLMMPTTSVTGLGLVLSKANMTKLTDGVTTDLIVPTGTSTAVDISPPPQGQSTVNFAVALACGQKSDCTVAKINAGADVMTLTLTFGYH